MVIIYISLFGIVIFSVGTLIYIGAMISSIYNNQTNLLIVYLILSIAFLIFASLLIFVLNRYGYKVYYDKSNNIIYRKGFICGYKCQVKIENIHDIIVAPFPKETTYYMLLDSDHTKYDGGSKKSFIRIEKTQKNEEFIKQFWDKQIKEYKEYGDLFK